MQTTLLPDKVMIRNIFLYTQKVSCKRIISLIMFYNLKSCQLHGKKRIFIAILMLGLGHKLDKGEDIVHVA